MHQSIVILPPTSGKSGANVRHFSSSVISGVPDYVGDFFCIAPRPLYVAKADPGEGPGGPGPTPFSGLNWGSKGRKIWGGERPSPLLSKVLEDDRSPPPPAPRLSQGLDPALCEHCVGHNVGDG